MGETAVLHPFLNIFQSKEVYSHKKVLHLQLQGPNLHMILISCVPFNAIMVD